MTTTAETPNQFTIELNQLKDFQFQVQFDKPGLPLLATDEPPPLGGDAGPNPSRLLAAAVANCLAASLLFAMRKFGNQPDPLRATATLQLARNEQGRWRVGHIAVDLHLGQPSDGFKSLERVLAQFEDFCVVTQSVRAGFPVAVQVLDPAGTVLHRHEG
ncbi:OsmC family protein [Ideonella sp. DXS29W]|uniref:OsmC family protein n=1 Tax=Ideonella lacteola TaxID=2984193 RepID=A0ABU9BXM0_9BURK